MGRNINTQEKSDLVAVRSAVRSRRFVPKGERRRRRFYAQEEAAERGMMVHRAHGHPAGLIPE